MYYNEKTAARIINALIASVSDTRPQLKHAWIDSNGRMCACDGFRAYRLNVPVAGVPDIEAVNVPNLDDTFPPLDHYKPLDLPTLDDVRAMIEEDKRAAKRGEAATYIYTFGTSDAGEQLPAVNLKYLADILQLFPNALAYYNFHSPFAPVIFLDENGDAMLLPLRINDPEMIDVTRRREAIPQPKREKLPALGLRTFAAIYAG